MLPLSCHSVSTLLVSNKFCFIHKSGGIPASLEDSGELWDFPNCWPPLQAFFIQGLDRLETKTGSTLAFHFAEKFIQNCYNEFKLRGTTLKFVRYLNYKKNMSSLIIQHFIQFSFFL